MYLIDTNIISESRKGAKANKGVVAFFAGVKASEELVFLSSISVGELRRGVELVRCRGDAKQAERLEEWLTMVVKEFGDRILALDADAAQAWGRLMASRPEHILDKQIAAIALVNDLTLVTRNVADFANSAVRLINPFV